MIDSFLKGLKIIWLKKEKTTWPMSMLLGTQKMSSMLGRGAKCSTKELDAWWKS